MSNNSDKVLVNINLQARVIRRRVLAVDFGQVALIYCPEQRRMKIPVYRVETGVRIIHEEFNMGKVA